MDVGARYDRIAERYDRASRVPNLLGFRDRHYHRVAVDLLAPEPGSTVLVLGCGTGIDFARLMEHIGPDGRIIGIDLSEAMLEQAQAKADAEGWPVTLVHGDVQTRDWPSCDHVLASFTLKFMPDMERVVGRIRDHLPVGGRLGVADFRVPAGLRWAAALVLRPFGHDRTTLSRHPARAIRRAFATVRMKRFWFGGAYALVAE